MALKVHGRGKHPVNSSSAIRRSMLALSTIRHQLVLPGTTGRYHDSTRTDFGTCGRATGSFPCPSVSVAGTTGHCTCGSNTVTLLDGVLLVMFGTTHLEHYQSMMGSGEKLLRWKTRPPKLRDRKNALSRDRKTKTKFHYFQNHVDHLYLRPTGYNVNNRMLCHSEPLIITWMGRNVCFGFRIRGHPWSLDITAERLSITFIGADWIRKRGIFEQH